MKSRVVAFALAACCVFILWGCSSPKASPATNVVRVNESSIISEPSSSSASSSASSASSSAASSSASSASSETSQDGKTEAKKLYKELGIKDMTDEYRDQFEHGEKGSKYQKYIVLHDTEGGGEPSDVVHSWGNDDGVIAAHFVVGRDGTVVQCVDLDKIAHHAGFGDTGHNELYGVEDESRDDKEGTEPIGDWASDYGMNSYSIGIEMVHVGGEDDYPDEQLEALDKLIAYIDAYYGKKSKIIDHKAWRSGNSDTSEEFSEYLENYQDHRTHDKED